MRKTGIPRMPRSPQGIYFDSFNWFGYSFYTYYSRFLAGRAGGIRIRGAATISASRSEESEEMALMDAAAPMKKESDDLDKYKVAERF